MLKLLHRIQKSWNLFTKAASAAIKTKNTNRNEKYRKIPSIILIILHLTMWETLGRSEGVLCNRLSYMCLHRFFCKGFAEKISYISVINRFAKNSLGVLATAVCGKLKNQI